ncbi:MAG: hypothetical protein ACK5OC_29085 [Pirellula sp.]
MTTLTIHRKSDLGGQWHALPQVRYSTLTQGNEAGVLYPIHH